MHPLVVAARKLPRSSPRASSSGRPHAAPTRPGSGPTRTSSRHVQFVCQCPASSSLMCSCCRHLSRAFECPTYLWHRNALGGSKSGSLLAHNARRPLAFNLIQDCRQRARQPVESGQQCAAKQQRQSHCCSQLGPRAVGRDTGGVCEGDAQHRAQQVSALAKTPHSRFYSHTNTLTPLVCRARKNNARLPSSRASRTV